MLAIITACQLCSHPARSEVFAGNDALLQIVSLAVEVDDKVTDGCFNNKGSVVSAAKANLSRSGIVVNQSSRYRIKFGFMGFASRTGGTKIGCDVSSKFFLYSTVPGLGIVILAMIDGLYVGPEALDARLSTFAEQFTNEVVTAILQARMAVSAKSP